MKKLIPVLVLSLGFCLAAAGAEVSKEKRQEIEKMLRLTGMERIVSQMMTQLVASLKGSLTDVPEEFWTKFQEKVKAQDLLEEIIPLYDKYYSLEDLKAVNAFYESPAGKKILATLPQIMQESMKIGQQWGAKIGRQAAQEAEEEMAKKKQTQR
jgi:uncharacterized protein